MKTQILQQGAEAIISLKDNQIIKNRVKKAYRIPVLDKRLRKARTKSESKIMIKLKPIINVPKIIETSEDEIIMEHIEGKKLSEHFDNLKNKFEIAEQIGKQIAKLHDSDIIHGDLTTSNMIYVESNNISNTSITSSKLININNANNKIGSHERARGEHFEFGNKISNKNSKCEVAHEKKENEVNFKVYFIDFGLGFHSSRIEDKAVDLHLIKQALEAKHFKYYKQLFEHIIKAYNSKDKDKILKQLEKVEARGRYKH